jgi:uncharacterized protein
MKFLLVLVVVLVGVWLWRRSRAEDARDATQAPPPSAARPPAAGSAPADMVSCRHCGLHLPAAEAMMGAQGPYCSAEHLRRHEP